MWENTRYSRWKISAELSEYDMSAAVACRKMTLLCKKYDVWQLDCLKTLEYICNSESLKWPFKSTITSQQIFILCQVSATTMMPLQYVASGVLLLHQKLLFLPSVPVNLTLWRLLKLAIKSPGAKVVSVVCKWSIHTALTERRLTWCPGSIFRVTSD